MIQALQLILALSFLVIIHELGHFTFAKIFHVRVEKFYMFFNPQISLVRMKKFGGKWHFAFFAPNVPDAAVETGETDKKGKPVMRAMTDAERAELPEDDWRRYPDSTEWGIGWVPLGGYCSIAGMVDETKSVDDLASVPQKWEFRSQAVWKRMLIIIGGILVNFVAGLLIFISLIGHYGTTTMPLRNVDKGLYFSEIFVQEGFRQQDRILTINGREPQDLHDCMQSLVIAGDRDVVLLRGQDTVRLTMSADFGNRFLARQTAFDRRERERARDIKGYKKKQFNALNYYVPFVIDSVMPGGAASFAGLQVGDSIVEVGGLRTPTLFEVKDALSEHPCDSVAIGFYRDGVRYNTCAFLGDECLLGVTTPVAQHYFATEHTDYTWFEAIPAGLSYGWDFLRSYVQQFRLVFSKEGAQSLGGFVAIGNMFPDAWSWYAFWHMTAVLSLILAFMNFLPIPALDGGYILFLLWEMLTRRKPSDKFLEIANQVGFYLLLALLILANGNDILKLFF